MRFKGIFLGGVLIVLLLSIAVAQDRILNIESIVNEFVDLDDTPNDYSGDGGNCVAVNAGETALEFVACAAGGGGGNVSGADDPMLYLVGEIVTFNDSHNNDSIDHRISIDQFNYNQSNTIYFYNMTDTIYFYNMSDGAGGSDNSSWNESHADTLYATITWNYNQTNTIYFYNHSNTIYFYNMTDHIYFYNMSDGTGSGNTSWNESHADTLYADILYSYNQTDTIYFYNMSDGSGGGINVFDQWLNTTDNVLFNNVNITNDLTGFDGMNFFVRGEGLTTVGMSNPDGTFQLLINGFITTGDLVSDGINVTDYINANDWSNVTIAMTNLIGTDDNACTGTNKVTNVSIVNGVLTITCGADVTGSGGKDAGGGYVYNDSTTIYFNGTELNNTCNELIDADEYHYNQTDTIYFYNMTDTIYFYNMSDGAGGSDNSSWNESHADDLYSSITWGYNQTDTIYFYNMTDTIYFYNMTDTIYFYNMSDGTGTGNASWNESHADTLYATITWNYNQTNTIYFYNHSNTIYFYNMTDHIYFYNMSDGTGTGNASWNESHADTLYAAITYNYNQTDTIYFYNMTDTIYFYNMSDGTGADNASWNESHADDLYATITYDYNQTTPATEPHEIDTFSELDTIVADASMCRLDSNQTFTAHPIFNIGFNVTTNERANIGACYDTWNGSCLNTHCSGNLIQSIGCL